VLSPSRLGFGVGQAVQSLDRESDSLPRRWVCVVDACCEGPTVQLGKLYGLIYKFTISCTRKHLSTICFVMQSHKS